MKKVFSSHSVAAILLAAFSTIAIPANAIEINPKAQSYVDTMVATNSELNAELAIAITEFPSTAESLVAAAIAQVGADSPEVDDIIATAITSLGVDSPLIDNILILAAEAGVDVDNLIALAIANGVDPTLATEALALQTAAGSDIEDTTSGGGTTANTGSGTGSGGGGGGISANQ